MGTIQSYGLKCYSKHALDLLHLAHNFMHYTSIQIIDLSKREDLDFHVMKMVDRIVQDDRHFPDGEISLESSYLKNDHFWTQTKVNHLVADAIQHTIHLCKFYEPDSNFKPFNKTNVRNVKTCPIEVYAIIYKDTTIQQDLFIPETATKGDYDRIQIIRFKLSDFWLLHDFFRGCSFKKLLKRYSEEDIKKVIGEPRNPMWIEQVKMKVEELDKTRKEYVDMQSVISREKQKEIDAIDNAYAGKFQELRKKFDKSMEEIYTRYANITKQWEADNG